MMPYERLEAWQRCHKLAVEVYLTTKEKFPPEERFGLTSQMRRAAYSASLNIAEGVCKRGPREFRRFLDISIGSLGELANLLVYTKDIGLLPKDDWKVLTDLRDEVGRVTWGLYKAVSRAASQAGK